MCQRAVDLDRNLEQVRSALGDLEAQLSARQQMEIAEAQRDIARQSVESQESAHRIHMALVWIEVFIVVAYAAELVKFFVIELPHIQDPRLRWAAGILSIGTGIAALLVLRPWDHRHGRKAAH
jgi:mannose/fructose/N-acetylgalactosamine-specific phosphotransferase system component IIC